MSSAQATSEVAPEPRTPTGMPCAARPFHEIGHDQEVAGKIHADDDAELEFQTVEIDLLLRMHAVLGELRLQPRFRLLAHLLFRRAAGFGNEFRQDRIALLRPEGAAARDLDRVLERFRQIGELRRHFGGGFEAMLARQAAAVVLADEGAVGDAEQRVVRLVHILAAPKCTSLVATSGRAFP